MENRKMHSRTHGPGLPRTSRVNDKIMEYCVKFGHDRDLEKFMRLYSPSSSCSHHSGVSRIHSRSCSHTTTSTSSIDGVGSDMRHLFRLPDETTTSSTEQLEATTGKEHIIPIRIEGEEEDKENVHENDNEKNIPSSTEATPKKWQASGKQATPDSIAKTHKRLEWDSLADIGYKKSMSTSNISILERSLLREFFLETEKLQKSSNASEGDLEKLQAELLQERKLRALPPATEQKHSSTPPLASSTMVVEAPSIRPSKSSSSTSGRVQQKTQSTSTSTSLRSRRQSEKYAQTTASRRANCVSQEVQVSMSSAATPSLLGSTATPTSFEVYSSRSSRSTTTTTASHSNDDAFEFKISRRQRRSQPQSSLHEPPAPHPFVAGITEMLASRRRTLAEVSDNDNGALGSASLQQLHETLKSALYENKENTSSSSSFTRSPQLDLGIQLLCSLIEAKSLNAKQKKKLVRDIVRRISHMKDDDKDVRRGATVTKNVEPLLNSRSSSSSLKADAKVAYKHSKDTQRVTQGSTHTKDRIKDAKEALRNFEKPRESISEYTDDQLLRVEVFKKPSPPTTSANALAKLAAENATSKSRQTQAQGASTNEPSQKSTTQHQLPTENYVPIKMTSKNGLDKFDKASRSATPRKNETTTTTNTNTNRKTTATTDNRSNQSAQSTASSTSKDLTTQKAANEPYHSSANTTDDAEQASMREWLNPLTQSEIEYEQKKRELAKNSGKREKAVNKSEITKSDSERDVQLNWIEAEIVRLESLRHLLLKEDDDRTSTTAGVAVVAAVVVATSPTKSRSIKHTEKLYDTVASEQNSSSLLGESPERLVQEIEVIIEESSEDIINLNENLKRTKERKRETQIIYDKPTAAEEHGGLAQGQARFRTVKETIIRSEEQVLSGGSNAKVQRSKIDTPSTGNDSESVGSFVQQRKRDFLEHYKQKKKNHHAALQQQEQRLRQQKQRSASTGAMPQQQTISTHYSVPHMQRTYNQQLYNNYNDHITAPLPPHPPPLPTHNFTSTRARNDGVAAQPSSSGITQSSSSMFCISSEVSIPMGSNSSSSTPTTTHQYDDVAAAAGAFCYGVAGVGIQTGDSVMRMQPIFGPRPYDPFACWRQPLAPPSCMRTYPLQKSANVQVKPKAIAYVIQFDEKTSSENASDGATNSEEATTSTDDQEPPQLTLQDHLKRSRPKFLEQVKKRQAILDQIQTKRQERERELRDIVAADLSNASLGSLDRKLERLPPPATKQIRIFPTKQMKAMTSKHCATLPEILQKQERDREAQRRRGNRIIRDVFNRRLQKRVRNGQLDLNHSRTVI